MDVGQVITSRFLTRLSRPDENIPFLRGPVRVPAGLTYDQNTLTSQGRQNPLTETYCYAWLHNHLYDSTLSSEHSSVIF